MKSDRERVEELEEQLQRFAYIVSHDLNAPLRHIREFSKLLIDEVESANEEILEYKKYIDLSLEEVENKLKSLLKYSRIENKEFNYLELDSKEALKLVLKDLPDEGKLVELKGDFPKFSFDFESFKEIFHQILLNSLTFQEEEHPVQVSATEDSNFYIFTVSDRGPGIPEDKIDKAFKLFVKLNRSGGSGMGLTICRRLMDKMNGSVRLSNNVEQGMSAEILFPKKNRGENIT